MGPNEKRRLRLTLIQPSNPRTENNGDDMDFTTLMDGCVSDDILFAADSLERFASAVSQLATAKQMRLLHQFYDYLNSRFDYYKTISLIDQGARDYFIMKRDGAVASYMATHIPQLGPPSITIRAITAFARKMKTQFRPSSGQCISGNQVQEIMEYLDEVYNFSESVFEDTPMYFIPLNATNLEVGGENHTAVSYKDGKVLHSHMFIYNLPEDAPKNKNSVLTVFHELGHALHIAITKNPNILPEGIADVMTYSCYPSFPRLSPVDQGEIFADTIAWGLMQNSPFAKYNANSIAEEKAKDFYHEMVKLLFARYFSN